jgi:hypothetical protein
MFHPPPQRIVFQICIVNNRKLSVKETGSVPVLRWKEKGRGEGRADLNH